MTNLIQEVNKSLRDHNKCLLLWFWKLNRSSADEMIFLVSFFRRQLTIRLNFDNENLSSNSKKLKLIQSKIFDAKGLEKNDDEREVTKVDDIIFQMYFC